MLLFAYIKCTFIKAFVQHMDANHAAPTDMSTDSYFKTKLTYYKYIYHLANHAIMQSCSSCTMSINPYVYLTCIYLNTPHPYKQCSHAAHRLLLPDYTLFYTIYYFNTSCKPCNESCNHTP